MERELWPTIYRLLRDEVADFSQKSVQYQPWLIVAVLTWAALHDRPRYWACDPGTGRRRRSARPRCPRRRP